MGELAWIVAGGLLMSLVALTGALTLLLPSGALGRWLLPLVSLAAGTLLGGAFLHMIPHGLTELDPAVGGIWLLLGFCTFLALEQGLGRRSKRAPGGSGHRPFTYLLLIGDAVHNFVGGLAVAGTFMASPQAGIAAWAAAAAHEVPQELGDFGVLLRGGWSARGALFWNFVSALAFPVGAIAAWLIAQRLDVAWLVMFGAGNFIYIAAADLVPEFRAAEPERRGLVLFAFVFGLALMALLAFALRPVA